MLLKRSTCFLLRNSNYLRESFLPAHRNPIQTTNRFISISSKVSEPKDWCRKCFKCLTIGVEGGFRQNGGIFFGKLMNFFVDFFFFCVLRVKISFDISEQFLYRWCNFASCHCELNEENAVLRAFILQYDVAFLAIFRTLNCYLTCIGHFSRPFQQVSIANNYECLIYLEVFSILNGI